jgi:acyl carrier protein
MRFDARQWIEFHPHVAGAPFLSELVHESTNATESLSTTTFRQSIENAVPMQRLTLIEAQLLEQLGKVLRLDPGTIDKHAPFSNIGMDSLMSLELRNRLEASLGVKLSAALLFTYSTTVALSQHLLERIAPAPIVHENEITSMAPELTSGNADFDTGEEAIQAGSDSTLIDKLSAFEEYLK